jgi:putative redox protein
MTAKVTYNGYFHTTAIHIRSGSSIETDAPVDNRGKGERFSPTDLVGVALASCILTTIGLNAELHELNIDGAVCDVEKIMVAHPRRIGELKVHMSFPPTARFSDKQKKVIEHLAKSCPVMESLHPDCTKTLTFDWPQE